MLKLKRKLARGQKKFFKAMGMALSFGLSLALPIVGGALFGTWLDKRQASYPQWTLNFLFLGVLMSLATLYQQVKLWSKKEA